ncbi:heterokaryon incompatibility protein-domain-containing protein [Xylariales sp. AK1849]|nr:heterokaryon incompatibility protein-domain-containing protein [Xylariales sp. AK1849]
MAPPPPYESLSVGPNGPQIRLLKLHPAIDIDAPIQCDVQAVAISQCPPYEALSYCWGDPNRTVSVKCNGQALGVTENLYWALQHLRSTEEIRTLWIDAVCINQSDLAERSDQVVLMRDIFTRAERVVVWLGPAASDSTLAFDVLKRLEVYHEELKKRFTEDPIGVIHFGPLQRFLRRYRGDEAPTSNITKPDDARFKLRRQELVALRRILERPWWSRLWVIQELCVARGVIVLCGHSQTSWDDFYVSYLIVLGVGGLFAEIGFPPWLFCCILITELRLTFQRAREAEMAPSTDEKATEDPKAVAAVQDMLSILKSSMVSQATDPHDKIYGILGLVTLHPDRPGLSILPDYNLPLVECFKEATLAMITQSGNLDHFETLSDTFARKSLIGLPSWVPDLTHNFFEWEDHTWGPASPFAEHLALAILATIVTQVPKSEDNAFKACGGKDLIQPHVIDGSVLVLEGNVTDSVAVLGPCLVGSLEGDNADTWREYVQERENLSRMQRCRLIVQHCLRTARFADGLLVWEDMAFENPLEPTKEELETLCRVLKAAHPSENLNVFVNVYDDAWRPLLGWLRWLHPLKIFGARTGALTVYNIIVGLIVYYAVTRSETKSHLVPLWNAVGPRLAKTGKGHLALLPASSRENDSVVLLKGGKTPYVARPQNHRWEFVGHCYVDGIMLGEGWKKDAAQRMEFV